jgi:Transcriptional Coactivator p15 (PC4)
MLIMNAPAPLAVIDRRDGEQIRVAWSTYQNTTFLDVRLYFRSADGTMRPTRKGVTFTRPQLAELIRALQLADANPPPNAEARERATAGR